MDRCALFVDAGYVLTDGAMAVHGTRRRESVSWDYAGLLDLFGNLATERTRLPLLRCYWYEATVEGKRSAEHDALADLPSVKLRVAKMRPGHREGVEGEIHRDLTTLARNKAVSDVMVASAEEDLAQVIADVQDMGMRVTLLHIAGDGTEELSRALRQECDDIVEISATQLRPYVELIPGAEPPRHDEAEVAQLAPRPPVVRDAVASDPVVSDPVASGNAMSGPVVSGPVVNGNTTNGNGVNGNGNGHAPAPRTAAHAQPQAVPGPGQQVPVPPAPDRSFHQVIQPAAVEAAPADIAQPDRGDAHRATEYAPVADLGAVVDYSASVDYGSPLDYGSAGDYGPAQDYPTPAMAQPQPREDIYPAPVAVPPADDLSAARDLASGQPRADISAYSPGATREHYQNEGMFREQPARNTADRLQPVPAALPGNGSAQVRRLPSRSEAPGGQGQGQPPLGLPAPVDAGHGSQPGGQNPGGPQLNGPQPGSQPVVGQPTGAQPAVPVAPIVPADPNAMGYAGGRGGAPAGPPHPGIGPVGGGPQVPPSPPPQPQQDPQHPPMPSVQQAPAGQQPDMGGQSGPLGIVGQGGYTGAVAPGVSLAEAVQSAHEEGQAFGDSVARDAPALWLEAVLARKPRMPSDLEARLLQGSALPIDFLLHDEVRHALRRGFWDALERARR